MLMCRFKEDGSSSAWKPSGSSPRPGR